MQYKFVNIPIFNPNEATEELNKFIRSHRVISVKSELVEYNSSSYWCYVIEYVQDLNLNKSDNKKSKIDYREVLSEEDFVLYSKLRDLRKQISEEKASPVYTIFTNDQLAKIVTSKVKTVKQLSEISGIGKSKIDNYGDMFVDLLNNI